MLWTPLHAGSLGLVALSSASPGTVKFDVTRKQLPGNATALLRPLSLNNHWVPTGGYFIDVAVGTPPQNLQVLLDTGSSDLFVPSASAAPCKRNRCPGGSFNSSASASYHAVQEPDEFSITYWDDSFAKGSYATDIMSLGGAALSNFTFIVANDLDVSPYQYDGAQYGIMGVSYDGDERNACRKHNCAEGFTIPTVPDALFTAGYTGSRSYSLYLDDLEKQKGSILFGGIDTAKFTGELTTLSTQRNADKHGPAYMEQNLRLTSVATTFQGIMYQKSNRKLNTTVIIDSNTPGLHLPRHIFEAIDRLLPSFQCGDLNCIPCSHAKQDVHIKVGLTGANGATAHVNIPLAALIVPKYNDSYNSTKPLFDDGGPICHFLMYPEDAATMGDPFFRSAYIHFNLDQKTISLAQASYDTNASHIVPVTGPVPRLTGTGGTAPAKPMLAARSPWRWWRHWPARPMYTVTASIVTTAYATHTTTDWYWWHADALPTTSTVQVSHTGRKLEGRSYHSSPTETPIYMIPR